MPPTDDVPTHLRPPAGPPPTEPSPPPVPHSPAADAGRPFGRYRLLERLGAGGMGVVWKAWDTELHRVVALKQLLAQELGDPRDEERFQREARLAAKLRHPGIVAVHDVGRSEGLCFLTMEYVPGRTLGQVLAETRGTKRAGSAIGADRLAREVGLLAEVARAVAFAHGEGVIHRDLKPGNVLLDAKDRPYVMDFGLAKEVAREDGTDGTLTVSGQVMGTPLYMSPEQATGDMARVDVRSDVWALGVMLYEVLTGETPYERAGTPWEVIRRVANEVPDRPRARNRHAPEALEAVCLKALEKDRALRYGSASEVAAELSCWLRGEAMAARVPGVAERLWRGARRHRGAVAAAATVLFALGLAGAATLRARARTDRVLASLRENAQRVLAGALDARRRGDPAALEAFRPLMEGAYRDAVRELGDGSAEPAYCMGRFERAAMNDARATPWQDRALAIDPAFAPALYERAVLSARDYRRTTDSTRREALAGLGQRLADSGRLRLGGGGRGAERIDRAPTVGDLERESADLRRRRDEALEWLHRLHSVLLREPSWRDHPATLLRVGPAMLACIEGMQAAYGGRGYPAAKRALDRALAADPGLEEGWEALWYAAGCARLWDAAAEACVRGSEVDPGYLPHWLNLGEAWIEDARARRRRGDDIAVRHAAALAAFDQALWMDPASVEAWLGRAKAQAVWAEDCSARGRDTEEPYAGAVRDYDAAVERAPDGPEGWRGRGMARANWALARSEGGAEFGTLFAAAVADLTRAVELDPANPYAWMSRGLVHGNWGAMRMQRGEDARDEFMRGIADLARALELDPAQAEAWTHRGATCGMFGQLLHERGEDPGAYFAEGISDFERAARLDPASERPWLYMGRVQGAWAGRDAEHGADPGPRRAAALASIDEALRRSPRSAEAWTARGWAGKGRATDPPRPGEDPGVAFAAALADFGRALEANPAFAEAWYGRAVAWSDWATHRMSRGEDPRTEFQAALRDFEAAMERNPGLTEAWRGRSLARCNEARHRADLGEDPTALYAAAIADCDRALALDPEYAAAWAQRGLARANWGSHREELGEDPNELFAAAIADYGHALARNPGDASTWMRRGLARANASAARTHRGEDGSDLHAAALADYAKALELNPSSAETRVNRGKALVNLGLVLARRGEDPDGSFTAALADFAVAVARQPGDAEAWLNQGIARAAYAQLGRRDEGDEDVLRAAIADYGKALDLNPGCVEAWIRRGDAQVNGAVRKMNGGADAEPAFAAAIADHARALARNPESVRARVHRGQAHDNRGRQAILLGKDPAEHFRAAIADFDAALDRRPSLAEAHLLRGVVRDNWAAFNSRHGGEVIPLLREAVADFETSLRLRPGQPEVEKRLGISRAGLAEQTRAAAAREWKPLLDRGAEAINAGRYADAREPFEAALRLFEAFRTTAPARDLDRRHFGMVHYSLACVHALGVAGKDGPNAEPRRIAPEEASRARDRAFEHLGRALDLGWHDRPHLEADADLQTLHDDPRWPEIVRRCGE